MLLSAHSDDMSLAEWEELYAETMGTWMHVEQRAAHLGRLAELVPQREPGPASEVSAANPARGLTHAARAVAPFATASAWAAEDEMSPLDIEQFRTSSNSEVTLDDTTMLEAIRTTVERAPVVLAYESAPSGTKLKAAAEYTGGDARKAQEILAANFADMKAVFDNDAARAEICWRVATAIETGADVSLFVADMATGGGKVALTKSVSKNLLARLGNPKLLARNAREQLREKTVTTVVGHSDMAIGLYNRGLVIATGDDSASFALTGDAASSLSMVIGLKSLRDQKGVVANLADMAKSPGGWKTAYGWGALSGTLAEKGANQLSVLFGEDGAQLTPEAIMFLESIDDADAAELAFAIAEPSLEGVMAVRSEFDARWGGPLMSAWGSPGEFGVRFTLRASEQTPGSGGETGTPPADAGSSPGLKLPQGSRWTAEDEAAYLADVAGWRWPITMDTSVSYREMWGDMELDILGNVVVAGTDQIVVPAHKLYEWLDANRPGWRDR